jgi:hypothetical protein
MQGKGDQGITVLFEFTGGTPAQEVRDYIVRNTEKTGLSSSDMILEVTTP